MRRSFAAASAGICGEVFSERDRRLLPMTLVALLLVGVPAGWPAAAAGQAPPASAAGEVSVAEPPGPDALSASCLARTVDDPFLAEVARARELESPHAATAALDALEPDARRMAAEFPQDPAAQYRLAAVMGARLDFEKGGTKMSGAEQLRDQALRVLELAPEHAGASYMLGKIHASVMRLGGFKRFMAKQLFGAGALKGASWGEAQTLLEVAVRGDPCVPEHHFELARVYAQRGDPVGAERELAQVRALTEGRDGRVARLRARADQLEREWSQKT